MKAIQKKQIESNKRGFNLAEIGDIALLAIALYSVLYSASSLSQVLGLPKLPVGGLRLLSYLLFVYLIANWVLFYLPISRRKLANIALMSTLCWMLITAFGNYILSFSDYSDGAYLLKYYSLIALEMLGCYVSGWFLVSAKKIRYLVIPVVGLAVVAVSVVDVNTLAINTSTYGDDWIGLGITVADSMLLAAGILAVGSKSIGVTAILIGLSIIVSIVIGARTTTYGLVFGVLVSSVPVIAVYVKTKNRKTLDPLLLSLVTVCIPFIYLTFSQENPLQHRIFQFLFEAGDGSVLLRDYQLQVGLDEIAQSPFIGSFGSDMSSFGQPGNYIHSYLEVWRQFGIIPFLMLMWLMISSLIKAYASYAKSDSIQCYSILVFLLAFVWMALFSRSIGYSEIFVMLGLSQSSWEKESLMNYSR